MLLISLGTHCNQADRSQFGQFTLHGARARLGKCDDFIRVETAAWIAE